MNPLPAMLFMRCYNARMQKPFQFSLRSLFVATTLIAIGVALLAQFLNAAESGLQMSVLNVIEGFVGFPIVGAGLFTPVRRPILGASLGALFSPFLLACLSIVTSAISV